MTDVRIDVKKKADPGDRQYPQPLGFNGVPVQLEFDFGLTAFGAHGFICQVRLAASERFAFGARIQTDRVEVMHRVIFVTHLVFEAGLVHAVITLT